MASRLTKTLGISAGIVVLLVTGLLIAPLFINVNNYKSQIEQQVEDATGRKLTIGTISASLFPWVGVELENVHFANRTGFAERDFASVKKLNIKLALLPLLSKRIEIKDFEIDTPDLYLERHSDGESNWGDLSKSSSAPSEQQGNHSAESADKASGAPLLAALQAEALTLSNAQITWVDGNKKPLSISELNVALQDVQLHRPVAVQVSGKLSGNGFELDAQVGPLGDLAKIDPIKLPIQGHFRTKHVQFSSFKEMISGWPEQLGPIENAAASANLNIEQRPDGIRLAEGQLTLISAINLGLDWKVEMPDADKLNIRRATLNVNSKNLMEIKGNVSRLSSDPKYDLHIDGQEIERSWLTTFVPDLKRMYATHPAPWSTIKLATRISGDSKQVEINDMQLLMDKDLLQIAGAIGFDGPDIRLRINGRELHMDPWLPQAEKEKTDNTASASATKQAAAKPAAEQSAEPDLRFLKSWRVTAKLNLGSMYMRGMKMGQFNVNINGDNGLFNLNPLSFNLSGGTIREKASLNAARFPANWSESVQIKGVQVGPLLKGLADMDMLEGAMDMDTDLHGGGLTPAAVNTLNGHGNVVMKDGKIKGFDIAGAIRKFTNPMAAQNGPQETDFAQLSGSFNIKNGVATNNDLFMASPLLRITGNGVIDLVQKAMDYHVKPRVVGTLIGQGDSSPVRKGLTVPLHISGPFATPKVVPEIDAKTLIENAPAVINKGKIGGTVGKILDGVQNQPASPTTQPEQAPQPQTPQQKLLKGLGGALGF